MKNKILQIASRVKLYMGVHSYSQMWLTPWAWGSAKPSDYSELVGGFEQLIYANIYFLVSYKREIQSPYF